MATIQEARASDAESIKELLFQTWSEVYKDVLTEEELIKVTSDWHSIELLEKQIKDPEIQFLVVKEDNKIIAMCNTGEMDEDMVELQRLHVLPGHQRKGLGTKLLNEVIRRFPNINTLRIEVEQTNKKAIDFYIKSGFDRGGKIVLEVGDVKIPCIEMCKAV